MNQRYNPYNHYDLARKSVDLLCEMADLANGITFTHLLYHESLFLSLSEGFLHICYNIEILYGEVGKEIGDA